MLKKRRCTVYKISRLRYVQVANVEEYDLRATEVKEGRQVNLEESLPRLSERSASQNGKCHLGNLIALGSATSATETVQHDKASTC
jgi:hypothetical protein